MNSSIDCHEIEGCPHLFIDAFRGPLLRKTSDSDNTFILTHYHGDHYQSLPRDNKYQGPALIHCTPVTAALLLHVHQVPAQFVREHAYEETWEIDNSEASVTFYDANHCPGAAIVLLELPDGNHHLHCGDMRYSPQMKEYRHLKRAVENRKIDLVYLDTTYGHPKHDFCPQSEAVDQIATVVERLTNNNKATNSSNNSTLVLLSCYSIGKEKVLWECAHRAQQPIFVSDKKYKMLAACRERLDLCTLDASATDIHVIPMGLAGELWPYFQPNYSACRDYAEALEHHNKRYSKVVAFLPTGWANGSNWNKKNAVVTKSMPYKSNQEERIEVEIRLVGYSEHSAFTELVDFVTFLKPRKVIPTVYSDESDRRKIVSQFRNLVDTARAKQKFFASMKRSSPPSAIPKESFKMTAAKKPNSYAAESDQLQQLESMGFATSAAERALHQCQGSVDSALEVLLSGAFSSEQGGTAEHPVEIDSQPPPSQTIASSQYSPKNNS
jgi:DNA repair metallo-beta-lactamase/UBA/TS-N domain